MIIIHKITLKLLVQATVMTNILVLLRKLVMGRFQFELMMPTGKGQTLEVLKRTRWNLMEEAKLLPPVDECLIPVLNF